jgi:hypothetical protein
MPSRYLSPADRRTAWPDARAGDAAFFGKHKGAAWRARFLFPEESREMASRAAASGGTALAIMLHHGRLGDKRALAGIMAYPCLLAAGLKGEARLAAIKARVRRMVAHFAVSDADFPEGGGRRAFTIPGRLHVPSR